VWRTAVLESVDVVFQTSVVWVDRADVLAHSLLEEVGVVDTLSTGQDLLTTHEEVVRVAVAGIGVLGAFLMSGAFGRWHGVEWADVEWEFVEDVEVGAVLLEDKATEALLVRGAVSCQ